MSPSPKNNDRNMGALAGCAGCLLYIAWNVLATVLAATISAFVLWYFFKAPPLVALIIGVFVGNAILLFGNGIIDLADVLVSWWTKKARK